MSSRTDARKSKAEPLGDPQVVNLQQVLERVSASTTLSQRRRHDIASALRTLARCVGRPLDALPCGTASVRELVDSVAPARFNITRGRWTNVRSLVFRSLDLAGIRRMAGRSKAPISTSWEKLLKPLPLKPCQVALLPLARHCTVKGVEPAAVSSDVVEAFGRDLEAFSGRARPRSVMTDAARAWNRLARERSSWPAGPVQIAHRRDHYSLSWSQFPPTLEADIDRMVADACNPDPTNESNRRPIRRISAENRKNLLRMLASAMVRNGHQVGDLRTIEDLLDIERVKDGIRFIHGRLGGRKTTHNHQIAKLLCVLARYYANTPPQTLQALRCIVGRTDPGRSGMTDKNRATLRPFEDRHLVTTFLNLPARVWRQRRRGTDLKMSQAVRLQVAFAVEVLTFMPIRIKNLAQLQIERNIIDQGHGRQRRVHIYIPAEDVKTGRSIEFELPTSTIALLDRYLLEVRPKLLRGPSIYVFPGEGSGHKGAALLSEQIANLVEQEIGQRLTAHQFRHLAGFLYLQDYPGAKDLVRQVLGHRSSDTTNAFYAGMEEAAAARHYGEQIERLRSETRVAKRRWRRRT